MLSSISSEYLRKLSKESIEALSDLALEGINISDDCLRDLSLLDAGEMTEEEFLKRAIARETR